MTQTTFEAVCGLLMQYKTKDAYYALKPAVHQEGRNPLIGDAWREVDRHVTDHGRNGLGFSDEQLWPALAKLVCVFRLACGLLWPDATTANKLAFYEPKASAPQTTGYAPEPSTPAINDFATQLKLALARLESLYTQYLLPSSADMAGKVYSALLRLPQMDDPEAEVETVLDDVATYTAQISATLKKAAKAERSAHEWIIMSPTFANWQGFYSCYAIGTSKEIVQLVKSHNQKITSTVGDEQQLALNTAFKQIRAFYK